MGKCKLIQIDNKIMKCILVANLILVLSCNSIGQTLIVDSLFALNGSEIIDSENQQRSLELFKSLQGDYRIVGKNVVEFGPPFFYHEDYYIYGLNQCGEIDSNYASNGKLSLSDYILQLPENLFNVKSYGWSSNDKFIITGRTHMEYPEVSIFSYSPFIIKVLPNGVIDTNFLYHDNTLLFDSLSTNSNASYNYAEELTDGEILCIGQYTDNFDEGILLVQYKPNGELDSSFGEYGYKKFSFPNLKFADIDILKTSDDQFTIIGEHFELGYPILFKLNTEGFITDSFGVNGVYIDSTINCTNGKFAKLQESNTLIVRELPISSENDNFQYAFLRYTAEGLPDSTFGENGKTFLPYSDSLQGRIIGVSILENNRILVGFNRYYNDSNGSTIILSENGNIDSSIAANGRLINDINGTFTAYGASHSLSDGRVVMAGILGANDIILTRFTSENTTPNLILDGNILTSNVTSNSVNFHWFLNGIELENSNSSTIEISSDGEYVVEVNDAIECGSKSDTLIISTVNNTYHDFANVYLSPNPSNTKIIINNLEISADYIIYNLLGQTINSGVVTRDQNNINVSELENGLYVVQIAGKLSLNFIKN
jgi:uncharacterized delta-60 repeat protein